MSDFHATTNHDSASKIVNYLFRPFSGRGMFQGTP